MSKDNPMRPARQALRLGLCLTVAMSALGLTAASRAQPKAQSVAPLMLPYGQGWSGGIAPRNGLGAPSADWLPEDYYKGEKYRQDAIARGIPANRVDDYLRLRLFGHEIPPVSGIGPVTDGPAQPYFNNAVAREIGVKDSLRIADLTNGKIAPKKEDKPYYLWPVRGNGSR